jgi:hypothetical protein
VQTEDVVNVLRNVHGALVPQGLLLDAHPLGADFPVHAGTRGLGFVDARRFLRIVEAMDACVAAVVTEGLFEEVRTLRRRVAERFENGAEALEHADEWVNLRLPAAVRRRLLETDERPVEFVEAVVYRLLRKRSRAS